MKPNDEFSGADEWRGGRRDPRTAELENRSLSIHSSEDQSALTYRQTVTDRATFTGPAVHESQHLALGETIEPFVCAPER